MHNILTLYNPYYQDDVIEQHVEVLQNYDSQTFATVAFGKIRSKLRDYEHPFEEHLQKVYASASEEAYLQLFLTDYSSIYVAKVVEVLSDDCLNMAPPYYKEKGLDVENWFIISDIRRIIANDFEKVRDTVLGNFTAPNFGDHHYAIYGNSYVYPLVVEMDTNIDYFENENEDFRYFTEIYKSKRSLGVKESLINYLFEEDTFYTLHPNTQDAVISAEIEYQDNCKDPLYDFTGVVLKLAKAFEREVYLFLRTLFERLIREDYALGKVPYGVNHQEYVLKAYKDHKPNLGTNTFLLRKYEIKNAINDSIKSIKVRRYILNTIPEAIEAVKSIRNETAHDTAASLRECTQLRKRMLGIGEDGVLYNLVVNKKYM